MMMKATQLIALALAAQLVGCATIGDGFYRWEHNSATPASHGSHVLVGEWYGQPYDKSAGWEWAPRPHYCQFDNGLIVEAGFHLCPRTI